MSSASSSSAFQSVSWEEAMQRHHDHYVGEKVAGKLHPLDVPQYVLALERERAGLVKPLLIKKT